MFGQITEQTEKYRSDNYGNIQNRRESLIDGNLVRTLFYNNGEIAQWPFSPSGEWPSGSGHGYIDGMTLLVAAEVLTDDGVVHPLQTSYREWMDRDPVTGTLLGFEPLPGYSRINSEDCAISTNPNTWPESWPKVLPNVDDSWNGYWYGYFGRGVKNADFETFYVMDDSKDEEFARPPYNFHPISSDHNRGGLGLRVEVRNFAWSEQIAEDISFWHYDIINISDYSYEKTIFGFYIDSGVGGSNDGADDMASFDSFQDMVYCFDYDGLGYPGSWKTGYVGYAYLESPGNNYDGIDNDDDGMVDESRSDWVDNDGDWVGYTDLNNNGKWDADANEPLNDDVGEDGLGPLDAHYISPDTGEGDGIPTDGEPNFDRTDKDESDQIGLTSLSIYRLGDGGTGGGWPKDDESMWLKMQPGNFDTLLQKANISMVMGSGLFPLNLNDRDRLSTAIIFGYDLDDLLLNKIVAQNIYNNNYKIDEVKYLIPVTLTYPVSDDTVSGIIDVKWNTGYYSNPKTITNIYISSDGRYFEKIGSELANSGSFSLNTENYSDGIFYKIRINCYDGHLFGEAETESRFIINNAGNGVPQAKFYSPAEKQKIEGEYEIMFVGGDADGDKSTISLYYGTSINFDNSNLIVENLSDNITSYLWNTMDVANNSQYYLFAKIQNSFNNEVAISKPFSIENDRNLTKGELLTTNKSSRGTGDFYFSSINPNAILANQYRIDFVELTDSTDIGYNLFDLSNNEYVFENQIIGLKNESPFFNGGRLTIYNDTEERIIDSLTYWEVGNSNLLIYVFPDYTSPSRNTIWEEDFTLTFMDSDLYTTPFFRLKSNIQIISMSDSSNVDYEIFDNDLSGDLTFNDELVIIKYIGTAYRLTWRIQFSNNLPPNIQPIFPSTGDVFKITTTKKFKAGDQIFFNTDMLVGIRKNGLDIPTEFSLSQNYPNPFNPSTIIKYSIPRSAEYHSVQHTTLKVFDILGREVATLVNKQQNAGNYEVIFNASNLSSGVYFYRLKSRNFVETKKLILLR